MFYESLDTNCGLFFRKFLFILFYFSFAIVPVKIALIFLS